MAILNDVKLSLRLSGESFDTELEMLIAACKIDLETSGLDLIDEEDELTKLAIITFAKSQFGMSNSDSEKYQNSYNMLKTHMALSSNYLETEE